MTDMKYGEKEIQNADIETWPYDHSVRDWIDIYFPEFTCKCPRSGYPDFAQVSLSYIPNEKVVELKSWKLYLNSFRDRGISHENATAEIFKKFMAEVSPIKCHLWIDWSPRGNVTTTTQLNHNISL